MVNVLKNKYNSDLHWSYNSLQPGERSNLFRYTDKVNPKNTKLFCYIKPFDRPSPQRIEIHPETFELIDELFDLIFYLILVQGDKSNPQIRLIAIAEKYAREMIKTANIRSLLVDQLFRFKVQDILQQLQASEPPICYYFPSYAS
jgi:hypothetical protein